MRFNIYRKKKRGVNFKLHANLLKMSSFSLLVRQLFKAATAPQTFGLQYSVIVYRVLLICFLLSSDYLQLMTGIDTPSLAQTLSPAGRRRVERWRDGWWRGRRYED